MIDASTCAGFDPRRNIIHEQQLKVLLFFQMFIFLLKCKQVRDTRSMQLFLGYNRFQTDNSSKNDSCRGAISCRQDLEPNKAERMAYGATDAKCSSAASILSRQYYFAKIGPTTDDQPVFCWNQFEKHSSLQRLEHNGQPDCFDFSWTIFEVGGFIF